MNRRSFLIGGSALVAAASTPAAMLVAKIPYDAIKVETVHGQMPLHLLTGDSLRINMDSFGIVDLTATRSITIKTVNELLDAAFRMVPDDGFLLLERRRRAQP